MDSRSQAGLKGLGEQGQTFSREAGSRNLLLFLLPSLLGLVLFMVPFHFQGSVTIFVTLVAKFLEQLLGPWLPLLATIAAVMSAGCSMIVLLVRPGLVMNSPFFGTLLNVGPRWTLIRLIAACFSVMILLGLGPGSIISDSTGAFVLKELVPVLFCIFAAAGLLLPFLLNFGLIEFCGVLLAGVMRPVFTLPGRSSVDCLASWVGDGTIGVLLTSKQYEDGCYTKREAAVIGTTFSVVSVTFAMVILSQVRLESLFPQFYLTVFLAGLVAAIILPRAYPLSKIPDVFIDGSSPEPDREPLQGGPGGGRFALALSEGMRRAARYPGPVALLREGIRNVLDMWLGVLPTVLCFGTIALAVAKHTSVFRYLSLPFKPLLDLLNVPDPDIVAPAIILGFADMFLPSVMVSSLESGFTRFVVAALSVSQLIYMSEVGSLLLSSRIPVGFRDLVVIFLLRTVISLPIIVACAHMIF